MDLVGRYHDGLVSLVRDVICRVEAQVLVITDLETRTEIDRWKADEVYPINARRYEVRVGVAGRPYGARLAFNGFEQARAAHAMLPALNHKHRAERGKQY